MVVVSVLLAAACGAGSGAETGAGSSTVPFLPTTTGLAQYEHPRVTLDPDPIVPPVEYRPVAVDDASCPPGPGGTGPIRVGINGGGWPGTPHIDGLRQAFDEANADGGIRGRPLEIEAAVSEGDDPEAQHHVESLIGRGDLDLVVPWGPLDDADRVAQLLASACLPALFWMASSVPASPWIVPGPGDLRADGAVVAAWLLAEERRSVLVAHLPANAMGGADLAAAVVESLARAGIGQVAVAELDLDGGGLPDRADGPQPEAIVILATGSACLEALTDARRLAPDAVRVVVGSCMPYSTAEEAEYEGVVRPGWLADPPGDQRERAEATGLVTGRLIVEVLRGQAILGAEPLDDVPAGAAMVRAATRLSTVVIGTYPGLPMVTNGADDRFVRESGVIERWAGAGAGWEVITWSIDAEGLASDRAIDADIRPVAPPTDESLCPTGGDEGAAPVIETSHWFGEDGRLDPLADIVLTISNGGRAAAGPVVLAATGADGRTVELPLVAIGDGAPCPNQAGFGITLGAAEAIGDLPTPVAVVFRIGEPGPDLLVTAPVLWPDDFPQGPPFPPVVLRPAGP